MQDMRKKTDPYGTRNRLCDEGRMMKQMTIKKKVTLWYTGIIALILGMVLVFMFYLSTKSEFQRQKKKSVRQ